MKPDNTLNYESAQAQSKQLPESFRTSSVACIDQCKESGNVFPPNITNLSYIRGQKFQKNTTCCVDTNNLFQLQKPEFVQHILIRAKIKIETFGIMVALRLGGYNTELSEVAQMNFLDFHLQMPV